MDVGVECVSVSVYGSLCLCVSWLAVRVCVCVILFCVLNLGGVRSKSVAKPAKIRESG